MHSLDSTLDWQASKEEGRLTVRAGVHPGLDELRLAFAGLPGVLAEVSREQSTLYPSLKGLSVVYIPQSE